MKTAFLTSAEVRKTFLRHSEHELTICLGDNAVDNLRASIAHARALLDSRRFDSVVYVNLPFSKRRMTDARREIFPKSERDPAFVVLHHAKGRLGPEFDEVRTAVKEAKGKVAVMINSWEFASSSYRYKEQLLFAIHELVCDDDVTVFIYSQAQRNSVEVGVVNRKGLGRLTVFASGVMQMPAEQDIAIEEQSMKQLPGRASAQLTESNINDLHYADAAAA